MSYTQDDLASAIDKLGGIDLTDAEIEALTDILVATDDEVSGFGFQPADKGWITIQDFKARGWSVDSKGIRMTEGTL